MRGLIVVAKNLSSFIMALGIIITMFAAMFFAMLKGSKECGEFCTFWSSWFEVYNMILGNYGPDNRFEAGSYDYKATISDVILVENITYDSIGQIEKQASGEDGSKKYVLFFM